MYTDPDVIRKNMPNLAKREISLRRRPSASRILILVSGSAAFVVLRDQIHLRSRFSAPHKDIYLDESDGCFGFCARVIADRPSRRDARRRGFVGSASIRAAALALLLEQHRLVLEGRLVHSQSP